MLSLLFTASHYKNSKAVTDISEETNATIVIKPVIKYDGGSMVSDGDYINYSLTTECIDGRYKYTQGIVRNDGGKMQWEREAI